MLWGIWSYMAIYGLVMYLFIAGSILACSSGDKCVLRRWRFELWYLVFFIRWVAAFTATALTWNDDQSRMFCFLFFFRDVIARSPERQNWARRDRRKRMPQKMHRSEIWKWGHVMIWANVHGNVVTWMYILKQTAPKPPHGVYEATWQYMDWWCIYLLLVQSLHAALEINVCWEGEDSSSDILYFLFVGWLHSQQPHWLGTMISQGCFVFCFFSEMSLLARRSAKTERDETGEKGCRKKCTEVRSIDRGLRKK